jgi:hypothetical protein
LIWAAAASGSLWSIALESLWLKRQALTQQRLKTLPVGAPD